MQAQSFSHSSSDFLLERFVHNVLADNPQAIHGSRHLIHDALAAGADPHWLLAEILWPAAECVQQLRHDQFLSPRVFNHATRTLSAIACEMASALALVGSGLPQALPGAAASAPTARRLFVTSAPGEPSDLGAHLLTLLAEAHGFTVLFAGAHLSAEEIGFALPRLQPDAIVVHGSLEESQQGVAELFGHLRRRRFWPSIQFAAVGAMQAAENCGADLRAAHPLEILELLALSPDYRTAAVGTIPLQFPTGTTPVVQGDTVREFLHRHFPPRAQAN